jgi:hypothetical protein
LDLDQKRISNSLLKAGLEKRKSKIEIEEQKFQGVLK